MASPQTETWWSTFLDAQGRDSEEHAAFEGYLYTNGIPAYADSGTLQEAYEQFRVFMQESEDREADRGPDRATLVAQQAVAALQNQFMPKSRVSAPGVEKPLVAATRPKETREPMAGGGPGPEGEANVAAEGHAPQETPTTEAPTTEASTTESSRSRYGRRSSEESS